MTQDASFQRFEIFAAALPVQVDPTVAIAASRAGACGVVNLEYVTDLALARSAVDRLARFGRGSLGVKLGTNEGRLADLELSSAITLSVGGDNRKRWCVRETCVR